MRFRCTLAVLLALNLVACHRAKSKPAAPPRPTGPQLKLKGSNVDFGGTCKAIRFRLDGQGCARLKAVLWKIKDGEAHEVTTHELSGVSDPLGVDLWFTQQDGEPFGKKGDVALGLGLHHEGGGSKVSTSTNPPIEGSYPRSGEQFLSGSTLMPKQPTVILAKTLSPELSGESGMDTLESLQKHTHDTKDTVYAITVYWEPK